MRRPFASALLAWTWIWATGLLFSCLPKITFVRGEIGTGPSLYDGLGLGERMLKIFFHSDVEHYTRLAREGYSASQSSLVFFPGWPTFLSMLPGSSPEALALSASLANLLFLGLALWAWSRFAAEAQAPKSAWLVAFYPTSVFYAAAYPETAFLAFAGAAVWALWRGHGWGAALALALLVSVKHAGLPLAAGLVAWAFVFRRRAFGLAFAGFALAAAGVFAFYQSVAGDPLAWLHAQSAWNRSFSGPWRLVGDLYGKPVDLVLYLALLFAAPVLFARRAWASWREGRRREFEISSLALVAVGAIFVPLWFGSSTQSLYRIVLLGTPALFLLEPLFETKKNWARASLLAFWIALNLHATYRLVAGVHLP
jgi:hypothetical protein